METRLNNTDGRGLPNKETFDGIFHSDVNDIMLSNGWEYAYALGFAHGKDDVKKGRESEFRMSKAGCDDFEKGYHRGYSESF